MKNSIYQLLFILSFSIITSCEKEEPINTDPEYAATIDGVRQSITRNPFASILKNGTLLNFSRWYKSSYKYARFGLRPRNALYFTSPTC